MSTTATTIDPERQMLGEVEMIGQDRWEEIHRRAGAGASIRAIARELDVDRKTVRRCLRQTAWKPYERATRCVFRSNPITDSGRKRSLIPAQSDHPSWH